MQRHSQSHGQLEPQSHILLTGRTCLVKMEFGSSEYSVSGSQLFVTTMKCLRQYTYQESVDDGPSTFGGDL